MEFSGFTDWNGVAEVMAPLYVKAAQLGPGSPLLTEANLISKQTADPKARAASILQLVQGKVRYLAHAEAEGGYIPQNADDTWRLRYGDCKAKTVLLLALLHQLGLNAEPVLVNTAGGDALASHLPALLFDHVIVRLTLSGRDYWLDGAREGDRDLDALLVPGYGWVLPLGSPNAKLRHIEPTGPSQPQLLQIIRYDASAGIAGPEPTELKTTFRGDLGYLFHSQLESVAPDRLDAALKQYWLSVHTAFTAVHVAAVWDASTREETFTADGTSKLDWSGTGLELEHVTMGGKPDVERDPQSTDLDAPFVVSFPSYIETDESVVLPPNDHPTPSSAKAVNLDKVIAGVSYHRAGTLTGSVFRVVASQQSLQTEIAAAEARASVGPLTELGEQGIYAPAGSQAAAANDAEAIKSRPTTADGHVRRAGALLGASRFKEALEEYEAAIAIDPKSQDAWSGKAIAHAWLSDKAAETDADMADSLGRPEIVAARARFVLAENQHNLPQARALIRKALAIKPGDEPSLRQLISVDCLLGDESQVKQDIEDWLKTNPDKTAAAYVQAEVAHLAHDDTKAASELANADVSTSESILTRAQLYQRYKKPELARSDLQASIKLKPSVTAYLMLAQLDGGFASDVASKDVDAALKFSPTDLEAELWKVNAASYRHDYAEALRLTDKTLNDHPEVAGNLLVGRAQLHGKLGHKVEMDADFERSRAIPASEEADKQMLCNAEVQVGWEPELALVDCDKAIQEMPKSSYLRLNKALLLHRLGRDVDLDSVFAGADFTGESAPSLNAMCYGLAQENLDLQRALEFCDTGIKLTPKSSAILDSRAFVLLRLGRFDEALTAYNAVLAIDPKEYNSLYGRGIVEARLGRSIDSERDIKAAIAGRPAVKQEFTKMGVQ